MAQAQAVATEAQEVLRNRLQNGTIATLTNRTVANMQLIDSTSWSGTFTTLPTSIGANGGVARIEHRKGNQGSRAAVNYTITSAFGSPYAIILAWHAPASFNSSTSPNKVLGLLGRKSIIDDLTWDEIKTELDKASTGSSFAFIDQDSKLSMSGNIVNNFTTNMANLSANFLLMP